MVYQQNITTLPGKNTHTIQGNAFDTDGMYIINVISAQGEESMQISVVKH